MRIPLEIFCWIFSKRILSNIFEVNSLGNFSNESSHLIIFKGKVYEEASGVLGPDDEVVHTDLKHLSFLEMVLKETMRLFPPIPVIMRELEGDVKLGPRIIPTGTHVMACIYYVHRNPEVWKDPLKFTPERFLPEECSRRHKYAYLPGSGGPRNCIGMHKTSQFFLYPCEFGDFEKLYTQKIIFLQIVYLREKYFSSAVNFFQGWNTLWCSCKSFWRKLSNTSKSPPSTRRSKMSNAFFTP